MSASEVQQFVNSLRSTFSSLEVHVYPTILQSSDTFDIVRELVF